MSTACSRNCDARAKRNRTIIAAKKALSDGRCEACGMSLADTYGIDKLCLIAHHKDPIGGRDQASRTTFDDIALVCPNCHAVAHTAKFPLSIDPDFHVAIGVNATALPV